MKRMLMAVLATAAALMAQPALADPLKVVASFTILGDMAGRIGGDGVAVTTLVGPDGDAHVYEPTPADARALAGADLVIVNGLGFEGWMDRLVQASGYKGPVVVATAGIDPLPGAEEEGHGHSHDHGHGADPHAWQSVANAKVYAGNIADGLAAAAPPQAEAFRSGLASYRAELDALEAEIEATLAPVPRDRRIIVTAHDAFGYYARAYGVTFLAPVGISTETEPSAGAVARLIRQMKAENVRAVFVESIADPRMLDRIAAETGARIGGRVYSDALSGPDGPAPDYAAMMRHNTRAFASALGAGS
ncbi:metal ABC transporter substrate-binding protein (plasmid) [Skermanella mucosa]|uniref:metal ABC transporter substrate-binding protein n=1 Tax=Skermanella mucosa TaxID=1789672 RepID=UPI00192AD8D5|nr:metal ABC transporter substrate-binding protein [Skermanella mucosa]UEM25253.1 metal ABC transporter substrate-binding protein [Skermanella mucosa]